MIEFDEHVGWGAVESEAGKLSFHCTQIADGSREVKVGAAVRYEVVPGNLGLWEAAAIEPIS